MTEPGSPEVVRDLGRRRHRTRIVGGIVGVALIAGVVTFVVLWNWGSSRPVSMEEAQRRAGAPGTDESVGAVPFQPAPGIYRYRGEGTEHLDKPPLTQTQGPDIPGTVTHLEGQCWRHVNVWFDAATGLPVRNQRVITVHSSALIGGVTYEENGSFQLASMNPT